MVEMREKGSDSYDSNVVGRPSYSVDSSTLS